MADLGVSADVSRQREEVRAIIGGYLAQLVPGSAEYTQLQAIGQRLMDMVAQGPTAISELPGQLLDQQQAANAIGQQIVSQQQQRIAAGGAATPFEARTEQAFQGLRGVAAFTPEEEDIFNLLRGGGTTTSLGRLGAESLQLSPELQDILNALQGQPTTTPTGGIAGEALQFSPEQQAIFNALRGQPQTTPFGRLSSDILARAESPDQFFTSTFQPQLDLLTDQINREAARRGEAVLGGGIPLESLGRAGSELAVREAQAREQFRQQQLANAQALAAEGLQAPQTRLQNMLALLQRGQGATQNRLQNLLTFQNLGQNLRNRQLGVEESAVNLQSGRESRLTDLLASQTGTEQSALRNLLQRQTTRQETLEDQARAQEEARRQQLINLAVQGGALAADVFLPGSGMAIRAAGSAFNPPAVPGTTTPATSSGLLASQQAQTAQTGQPLTSGLNRSIGKMSSDDFAAFLRAFQAGGF